MSKMGNAAIINAINAKIVAFSIPGKILEDAVKQSGVEQ
jgi:hypothetical protein